MTNEELDILWFKAMRQSAEGDKALGHYHFAALVAAAEREACAKICDETRYTGYVPAEDGEARQYYDAAAEDCAEQIRARGEQEQPK